MPIEGFNPEEFSKNLTSQVVGVIPQDLSEEDKKFVVNIVYKFLIMAAGALNKDDNSPLNAQQASTITQFIGEWAFHKSVDLSRAKIPQPLREPVLQDALRRTGKQGKGKEREEVGFDKTQTGTELLLPGLNPCLRIHAHHRRNLLHIRNEVLKPVSHRQGIPHHPDTIPVNFLAIRALNHNPVRILMEMVQRQLLVHIHPDDKHEHQGDGEAEQVDRRIGLVPLQKIQIRTDSFHFSFSIAANTQSTSRLTPS